jgi:WD40 repeat protein
LLLCRYNQYITQWEEDIRVVFDREAATVAATAVYWRTDGCGLGLGGHIISEMIHHINWAKRNATAFCCRDELLAECLKMVSKPNRKKDCEFKCVSLALVGPAGSGKAALAAKLAQKMKRHDVEGGVQRIYVTRFCGTSRQSCDALSLIRSICLQIHASGQGLSYYWLGQKEQRSAAAGPPASSKIVLDWREDEVPRDYDLCVAHLQSLLATLPVVLIVDSLDGLTNHYQERSELSFLKTVHVTDPKDRNAPVLHPLARVVVTAQSDCSEHQFLCDTRLAQALVPRVIVPLLPARVPVAPGTTCGGEEKGTGEEKLGGEEEGIEGKGVASTDGGNDGKEKEEAKEVELVITPARVLMAAMLRHEHRTITEEQWAVFDKSAYADGAQPSALYLHLASRVVRRWHSGDGGEEVLQLGHGVTGVVQQMLAGVEREFGTALTQAVLSFLCVTVEGVTDTDMQSLLSMDAPSWATAEIQGTGLSYTFPFSASGRLPIHLWLRVRGELEAYGLLVEYDSDCHRLCHPLVKRYVMSKLLSDDRLNSAHVVCAQYFGDMVVSGSNSSSGSSNSIGSDDNDDGRDGKICPQPLILDDGRGLRPVFYDDCALNPRRIFEAAHHMVHVVKVNKHSSDFLKSAVDELCSIEAVFAYARSHNGFAMVELLLVLHGLPPQRYHHRPGDCDRIAHFLQWLRTGMADIAYNPWVGLVRSILSQPRVSVARQSFDSYCLAFRGARSFSVARKDNLTRSWPIFRVMGDVEAAAGAEPKFSPLQMTLGGHTGDVRAVTFAVHGLLATGATDGLVKIWNVEDGSESMNLEGHGAAVNCVSFCSKGKQLASGGGQNAVNRNYVVVWDLQYGRVKHCLSGHERPVSAVCFSPGKGIRLVSSGGQFLKKGEILVWDTGRGELLQYLVGHDNVVTSVKWSPDGHSIASCDEGGHIKLWKYDVRQNEATLVHSTREHGGVEVHCCAFSQNSSLLITGSGKMAYGEISLWDTNTGLLVRKFHTAGTSEVLCLDIDASSTMVASGSSDCCVRVYDLVTGEIIHKFEGHKSSITSVAFNIGSTFVASSSCDGTACVWTLAIHEDEATEFGHTAGVDCVSCSHDGKVIVSGSGDKTLKVWSAGSGTAMKTVDTTCSHAFDQQIEGNAAVKGATTMTGTTTSATFVTGNDTETSSPKAAKRSMTKAEMIRAEERKITIFPRKTVKLCDKNEIKGFFRPKRALKVTPGASSLSAVPVMGGSVEDKKQLQRASAVCCSRDMSKIFCGGADDSFIMVFDAKNEANDLLYEIPNSGPKVTALCDCRPEDSRLLVGTADGTLKTWYYSRTEVNQIHSFSAHATAITALALPHHNSQRVISGAADGTVVVSESSTGFTIWNLTEHVGFGAIRSVAVSLDGHSCLTVADAGPAHLWDLTTGLLLRSFSPDPPANHHHHHHHHHEQKSGGEGGKSDTATSARATTTNIAMEAGATKEGVHNNSADDAEDSESVVSGSSSQPLRKKQEVYGFLCATFDKACTEIVTSSTAGRIVRWDVLSGEKISENVPGKCHLDRPIGIVKYLGTGTQLVQASKDGMMSIVRSGHRDAKCILSGHGEEILGLFCSMRGTSVISVSPTEIQFYDIFKEAHVPDALETKIERIYSALFSPDGHYLYSCSDDCTIKVWNASSGQLIETITHHDLAVKSLSISGDGSLLASCSDDGTLRLWDTSCIVENHRHHHQYHHHHQNPNDEEKGEGENGDDEETNIMDPLLATARLSGLANAVVVSRDGDVVGSCCSGGNRSRGIVLWDVLEEDENGDWALEERHAMCAGSLDYGVADDTALCLAFNTQSSRLVSGHQDYCIRIWEVGTGNMISVLRGHSDIVNAVSFNYEATRIISASGSPGKQIDNTVRVWETNNETCVAVLEGHKAAVLSLAVPPSCSYIVSASLDHNVHHWSLLSKTDNPLDSEWTFNARATVDIGPQSIRSVDTVAMFNAEHSRVVTGHSDGGIWIRDWASGEPLGRIIRPLDVDSSASARIKSYGSTTFTTDLDESYQASVSATGLHGQSAHRNKVTCLHFQPWSNILLSGSADTTARLWRLEMDPAEQVDDEEDGHGLHPPDWPVESCTDFTGHFDEVTAVHLSGSGTRVFTGSRDGEIRVWEAATGKQLTYIRGTAHAASAAITSLWSDWKGEAFVAAATAPVLEITEYDLAGKKQHGGLMTEDDEESVVSVVSMRAQQSKKHGKGSRNYHGKHGKRCNKTRGGDKDAKSKAKTAEAAQAAAEKVALEADKLSTDPVKAFATRSSSSSSSSTGSVVCARVSSGWVVLVAGLDDGSIRMWDCKSSEGLATVPRMSGRVNALEFSTDSNVIFGISEGSAGLFAIDVATGTVLTKVGKKEIMGVPTALCVSADASVVAVATPDEEAVRIFEVQSLPSAHRKVSSSGGDSGVVLAKKAAVAAADEEGEVDFLDAFDRKDLFNALDPRCGLDMGGAGVRRAGHRSQEELVKRFTNFTLAPGVVSKTAQGGRLRNLDNPVQSLMIRKRLGHTVDLYGITLADRQAFVLGDSLRDQEFIETIYLDETDLSSEALAYVVSSSVECPSLLQLVCSRLPAKCVTEESLEAFGTLMCGSLRLQSVHIEQCGLRDEHITALVNSAQERKTNLSLQKLSASISLAELNLRDNKIGPSGATALGRMFTGLQYSASLQVLNLDKNRIGGGVGALVAAFSSMLSLRNLNLSNNDIDDAAAEMLVNGLARVKREINESSSKMNKNADDAVLPLQEVRLGGNLLRARACFALATMVKCMSSTLRRLDVSNNDIGSAGARALLRCVSNENIPTGQFSVDLTNCSFSEDDNNDGRSSAVFECSVPAVQAPYKLDLSSAHDQAVFGDLVALARKHPTLHRFGGNVKHQPPGSSWEEVSASALAAPSYKVPTAGWLTAGYLQGSTGVPTLADKASDHAVRAVVAEVCAIIAPEERVTVLQLFSADLYFTCKQVTALVTAFSSRGSSLSLPQQRTMVHAREVLRCVWPRIIDTQNIYALLTRTLPDRRERLAFIERFRVTEGGHFRFCWSNPCGHYSLDLGKSADVAVMAQLCALNEYESAQSKSNQKETKRADTSQLGNWKNFRNMWTSVANETTRAAVRAQELRSNGSNGTFLPFPRHGTTVDFDYVSTTRPGESSKAPWASYNQSTEQDQRDGDGEEKETETANMTDGAFCSLLDELLGPTMTIPDIPPPLSASSSSSSSKGANGVVPVRQTLAACKAETKRLNVVKEGLEKRKSEVAKAVAALAADIDGKHHRWHAHEYTDDADREASAQLEDGEEEILCLEECRARRIEGRLHRIVTALKNMAAVTKRVHGMLTDEEREDEEDEDDEGEESDTASTTTHNPSKNGSSSTNKRGGSGGSHYPPNGDIGGYTYPPGGGSGASNDCNKSAKSFPCLLSVDELTVAAASKWFSVAQVVSIVDAALDIDVYDDSAAKHAAAVAEAAGTNYATVSSGTLATAQQQHVNQVNMERREQEDKESPSRAQADIVCALFPRITDLHNTDVLLHALLKPARKMVLKRLGYLNVVNPMKLASYNAYDLNLQHADARTMAQTLLTSNAAEGGQFLRPLDHDSTTIIDELSTDPDTVLDGGDGSSEGGGSTHHRVVHCVYLEEPKNVDPSGSGHHHHHGHKRKHAHKHEKKHVAEPKPKKGEHDEGSGEGKEKEEEQEEGVPVGVNWLQRKDLLKLFLLGTAPVADAVLERDQGND